MSKLPKKPSALAGALARRGGEFHLGDAVAVKDCRKDPALTLEVIRAFQSGRRGAAEVLLEIYEPFVLKGLRHYRYWSVRDLDDFVQEGRIAVLDACARWDFDRGVSSPWSYVSKYVKGYMQRYMMTSTSCVRAPVHYYGRTRISERSIAVRNIVTSGPLCTLSCEFEGRAPPAGIGVALPEDDDSIEDLLFDDEQMSTEEILADADLRESMRAVALSVTALLGDRERDILSRRFGPEDAAETLNEIGEDYGLSRERVRQLEERALAACLDRAMRMLAWAEPPRAEPPVPPTCSFEEWAADLADHVRGAGREQVAWEARARASTESHEAA